MQDLQHGCLAPLLERVKGDATLDLEIRSEYLNVYYRGGCLLRAGPAAGAYQFEFDTNYFLFPGSSPIPSVGAYVASASECSAWLAHLPLLKDTMDRWMTVVKGGLERESQQLLVRENNRGPSSTGTDYFACDMEYADPAEGARLDVVAVKWPSTPAARKKRDGLRLAFVELKFGDTALAGKAGLRAHLDDADRLAADPARLDAMKQELVVVFRQKLELGLVDGANAFTSFSTDKPEWILVIANHDPASSILRRELSVLPEYGNIEVLIATASHFGYGLYADRLVPVGEYVSAA